MSIEDLAKGDTVIRETATHAVSSSGDDVRTWTASGPLDCTVQTMAASDAQRYAANGSRFLYNVFFSADPSLTRNNRLKWATRAGVTLATPIYFKVLDCYAEGIPGEDQLWIADCEQETMGAPG